MLFIILGVIFSFLTLKSAGVVVFILFLFLGIFFKLHKKVFSLIPIVFLLLPFISFFDVTLLPAMLGISLCFENKRIREIKFFPYITIFLLCSYFIQFFYIFDDLFFIFKNYHLNVVYEFFNYNNLFYRNLFYIFLYHFSFLTFFILSKDKNLCVLSLKFLKIGSVFGVVFFLLHLFFPTNVFSGMNQYWISLNRYSGGFSDPNSAGISLFLMILLLFYNLQNENKKNKIYTFIICILLLLVGFFTGSRSFILGLMSFLVVFYSLKNKKVFWVTFLSTVILFFVLNIIFYFYGFSFLIKLPKTIERVLESLFIGNIENTFSSRFYFTTTSFFVFIDNFFTGVGFNNFYSYFPYFSNLLGFKTGIWQDSTCNFYFGILAEGGIVGLFFFLLSFGGLRLKKEKNKIIFCTIISFLIVLFFTSFLSVEFIILSALLFGIFFDFKIKISSKNFYIFLIVVLIIYNVFFFYNISSFYGFYNLESENRKVAIWTDKKSSFPLKCENGKGKLTFSAPRLSHLDYPVKGELSTNFGFRKELKILNSDMQIITLDCTKNNVVNVSINILNPWIPISLKDNRLLGVRLYFDNVLDVPLKKDKKYEF